MKDGAHLMIENPSTDCYMFSTGKSIQTVGFLSLVLYMMSLGSECLTKTTVGVSSPSSFLTVILWVGGRGSVFETVCNYCKKCIVFMYAD